MNILITGGASGLGEAISRHFASIPSNNVFFTYFKAGETAKNLENQYANLKAIFCDFTNIESVRSLLAEIIKNDIDVLINNAISGINSEYFHKIEAQNFSESFQKNILPVICITQEAIKHFRIKKSGKIITILSSYLINTPPVGMSEYIAEKAYLLALSKSWATENIKFNITSNCISPSFMSTNLTSGTDERVVENMILKHPLKSIVKVSEVAELVSFLASASQHINGENILMNAGENMR